MEFKTSLDYNGDLDITLDINETQKHKHIRITQQNFNHAAKSERQETSAK